MSQNQAILNYLQSGKTLTGLDALKLFQTMKLATRISELRAEGIKIKDETIETPSGKHIKKYWIEKEEAPQLFERKGQYCFMSV